jgi:hypothetical protein
MPNWKIVDKLAFVNGMVRVEVNIDLSEFPPRFVRAQQRLGEMVLASSKVYMPLLTGSLQQRSYVDDGGRKVVFPGPYGRYQYGGRVMVDSVTGKGPAMIHDRNGVEIGLRFRKGATLVPTERRLTYSQPNAQAEWFEPAKAKDLPMWVAECDRIIKGGT